MRFLPSVSDDDTSSSRVDRLIEFVSGFGLPAVLAVIGATTVDDPWDKRLYATALVLAAAVVWFLLFKSSRRVGDEVDLASWRNGVREVMYQSWVQADRGKTSVRAPLESVEHLRRDLQFVGDDSWLHNRFHGATDLTNGQPIDLGEDDGPGGVWELLDGSFLVIGEAGTGKSVLVWQTLKYLAETYKPDKVTPLLIEVFQWAEFDKNPTTAIPRFEDFIAWRLQDPSLGTPPNQASLLASEVVLLLDGYDELADLDAHKAHRFLDSLGSAREGGRIDSQIMLTSRPGPYSNIVAKRSSGTAAVTHSVIAKPYPADRIVPLLEQRDKPLRTLMAEVERCDSVQALLQRPLWLSLAIELFDQRNEPSPFAELENPTIEQCEQALYQTWVNRLGRNRSEIWKQHVGYLASRMSTGTQTLTMEQLQGSWLPGHLQKRYRRLHALINGLACGLILGLVLGLTYGVTIGLTIGPVIGLIIGLTSGLSDKPLDIQPVAQQRFDLRKLSYKNLTIGLASGSTTGLILGLTIGPITVLGGGPASGPIFGLIFGLFFGLTFGLDSGFIPIPPSGPPSDPFALLLADLRMKGIRALILGLSGGLFFGLAIGLIFGLTFGLVFGVTLGLSGGLFFGLGLSLTTGLAGLNHLVARVIAARAGLLPFQCVRFLDDLVSTHVMYRAGVGYRFRHRTLSRWLADEWNQTSDS